MGFKKVQTLGMALIDLLKLYIRIIILCLFKKSLTISRQAPFLHNLKIVNYINFATKVSTHKGLRIKFTIFLIRLYCKINIMIPLHNVYFSPTTIKRILCSFSLQKNVIFSEISNPTTYSFSCSIIFHINIRNIMRKLG